MRKQRFVFVFIFALHVTASANDQKRPWTSPKKNAPAEYGHGLSAADAKNGWIAIFDGKATLGWKRGALKKEVLAGPAVTTAKFGRYRIRGVAVTEGVLSVGGQKITVGKGPFAVNQESKTAPIALGRDLAVSQLAIRPLGLKNMLPSADFTGWKILHHPRNPKAKAVWTNKNGVVRAVGGPGALELQQRYRNFVLQMEIRATTLSNGGLFFRAIPGDFMNGYEAQIFNACYDHDPAQSATYSTGGIDDRKNARRLVSRDGEWFTMTVIANGPHIATWVNGFQQVDWTDTRKPNENPRNGLRLEPGTIQIQAHDPKTDFEFRNVRVIEIGNSP